ncbi:CubicO group peptidase, beta-lactamase class C family [bacterium A37T11]|nr:CubicO group peptidase, beta-lactamase class C family [bacterium A37T11]
MDSLCLFTDGKAILLIFLWLLSVAFPMAQDTAKIDRILSAYKGTVPGASLLVLKDGKPLLQRCYGLARLDTAAPVTAATNFRLASVSKQFTATCVLQLVQLGKLSLDDSLTKWFPGFPAYGQAITIRLLLSHLSGLPDYEDDVPDTAMNPQLKDQGVLDILMKKEKGYFEPGTQYRYSNSAYALLALLVGKISGQAYGDYLQQHIFKPLAMDHTMAFEKEKNTVPFRALGYSRSAGGTWQEKDQSATSAVLGDGGIYSNVLDLAKWDEALYEGTVLPAALIIQSFTDQHLKDGSPVHYGFGWHLKKDAEGNEVVYHTGSTTSFRNVFYRVPSHHFSLILLTNRNEPAEEDMLLLAEEIAGAIRQTAN